METKHIQVQIDNIKESVKRLEIERKEDRKLLTEAIIEMKENNVQLTTIIKHNNKELNNINKEVSEMKQSIATKQNKGIIESHSGKIMFALVVIIAGLLGIKIPL